MSTAWHNLRMVLIKSMLYYIVFNLSKIKLCPKHYFFWGLKKKNVCVLIYHVARDGQLVSSCKHYCKECYSPLKIQ